MRFLMIGGSTFMGRRIVERLIERGDRVTVFNRGRTKVEFDGDVEWIKGDRTDYARFEAVLGGRTFDAVIDMVAYDAPDVSSVMRTFAGRIGHYLVCSSSAVYEVGGRPFQPCYEDEADIASGHDGSYAGGKRAVEHALVSAASAGRAPFPFTCFRPTVVEGPGDPLWRTWYWVQRIADGGEVLAPVTYPDTLMRFVYSGDVADAFIAAAGNPAAFGKSFNLAGDEILTLSDYLHILARAVGAEPKFVFAPIQTIRSRPGLERFSPAYVGARKYYVLDIGRARADIGYRPTPTPIWLAETASHLLSLFDQPDSHGYELRAAEVAAARALGGVRA